LRNSSKEANLKIVDFKEREGGATEGVLIILQKSYDSNAKECTLTEKSYVNMSTTHNITFYKGLIVEKSIFSVPMKRLEKQSEKED
jgi:hypothetical protein